MCIRDAGRGRPARRTGISNLSMRGNSIAGTSSSTPRSNCWFAIRSVRATRPRSPFDKSEFKYDSDNDVYICPGGEVLTYRGIENKNKKVYRVGARVCRGCCYFGECTKSRRNGRKIVRYVNEEFRERLQSQFEQPDSQAIYELRKQKAQLPFGHIKRNLKAGYFLLRGLDGVRAEASLLASCFNLVRMITLIGVPALIAELAN